MLEMRPDCERCGGDLPPGGEAYICSFECTWCPTCVHGPLAGTCPNCGGDLQRRPARTGEALGRHPASTERRGPA